MLCISVFLAFGAQAQTLPEDTSKFLPLVTCGVGDAKPCTICDIWVLADRVVLFAFYLAAPILIIVLIAGGFIYLTSGGNPKKTEQAKSLLTSAIVGIVIALAAFLIVDTILKTLVRQDFTWPSWKAITTTSCPNPIAPTPVDLSKLPKPTDNTLTPELKAQLATNLRNNVSTSADCKDKEGYPANALLTIEELSRKLPVTVCSSGCTGKNVCAPNTSVNVSTKMLSTLHKLYEFSSIGIDFTITSITTGDHSSVSCHYSGNCVDITPKRKQDYDQLRSQLQTLGANAFCETRSGKQAVCATAGISDQTDPIDHIHASF